MLFSVCTVRTCALWLSIVWLSGAVWSDTGKAGGGRLMAASLTLPTTTTTITPPPLALTVFVDEAFREKPRRLGGEVEGAGEEGVKECLVAGGKEGARRVAAVAVLRHQQR